MQVYGMVDDYSTKRKFLLLFYLVHPAWYVSYHVVRSDAFIVVPYIVRTWT